MKDVFLFTCTLVLILAFIGHMNRFTDGERCLKTKTAEVCKTYAEVVYGY